jgi:hypothetical protein
VSAPVLDGNALAGLLEEVFTVDMTTAMATCGGCGAREPLGALRLFRGAGHVLRCSRCGRVIATIVQDEAGVWLGLRGLRTLRIEAG